MSEILAGRRRYKAEVYRIVEGPPDSFGQPTVVRELFHTAFAKKTAYRGREFVESAQVFAEARIELGMLFKSGIERAMQVDVDGRTLDIVDVQELDGDRRYTRLICRDLVP